MTSSLGKQEFLRSNEAELLRQELEAMVGNPKYNTATRYSLVSSDGSQFVEKHMSYMANHPRMDHKQYVLNIKLMTKLK